MHKPSFVVAVLILLGTSDAMANRLQGSVSTASGSPAHLPRKKGTPRVIPGSFRASSRTAAFAESAGTRGNPAICWSKARLRRTAAPSWLLQA